jgi:hypothetical protein
MNSMLLNAFDVDCSITPIGIGPVLTTVLIWGNNIAKTVKLVKSFEFHGAHGTGPLAQYSTANN